MNDIIIVAVPYTHINIPPLAPAVLKGIAESAGYKVQTIDLGMNLFKLCDYDKQRFDYIQEYFISSDSGQYSASDINFIDKFINDSAEMLVDIPSRYIGISIFSYFGHLFTYRLLTKIKDLDPDANIVVGGAGCNTGPSSALVDIGQLTGIEKMNPFVNFLRKRQLISHEILGDGEEALLELLGRNKSSHKSNKVDYKNKELPFANFDDYDLWKYPGQLSKGYPQIPIFGSKGCVRRCDFCDVENVQGRFRFRTGKNIFKEILYLADKYKIRDFNFTDSLVNGSLSSFKEWVAELADYNRNNPDKKITWNGSWICRPIGQMPEEFYTLMAESGCESLSTGYETGSDNVLKAMNKKTNVRAFAYELEQFNKHKIKIMGLFIVAHWSETWDDFLDTCNFFYRLVPYSRSGLLVGINLGATGILIKNTPADLSAGLDSQSMEIWWNKKNPNLTIKERYFRLLLLLKIMKDLKLPLIEDPLPWVYNTLQRDKEVMKEFYVKLTENITLESSAEKAYLNYEEFFDQIIKHNKKNQLDIELTINSSVVKDPAKLKITFNDEIVFDQLITEGIKEYKFTLSPQTKNNLKIKFYDKPSNGTAISTSGEIIKDTFIMIEKFLIDGIDIVADPDFFYNHLSYIENENTIQAKTGFWMNNSELHMTFSDPFFVDYGKKSNRNSTYSPKFLSDITLSAKHYEISNQTYFSKIVDILSDFPC